MDVWCNRNSAVFMNGVIINCYSSEDSMVKKVT